jgi:hypothetical protein
MFPYPLPQVWVDLRGRCSAALEDPDAFRPILGLGGPAATERGGAALAGTGASAAAALVLPAARFVEGLVDEGVATAYAMPLFAASLAGT